MKMVRAFIRPEKEQEVVQALEGAGFGSLTKMAGLWPRQAEGPAGRPDLLRRDAQDAAHDRRRGRERRHASSASIEDKARTGFIGDGKIFVSPVETAYTIRTGEAVL